MNKLENDSLNKIINIQKARREQEIELLSWWILQIDVHDYFFQLEKEKLEEFIQKIVIWYEIKYPDYLLEMKKKNDKKLAYLKDITKELDFEQLTLRLLPEERKTMNCSYRSTLNSSQPNNKKSHNKNGLYETENYKSLFTVTLKINEEDSTKEITFFADKFGIIERHNLHVLEEFLIPFKGSTTLKRVLNELKQTSPYIDISDLEKCIKTREIDLELRDKIIFLTSLFILSSQNHSLEHNYTRAISLITEYNDYYCRNLSSELIQELIFNPTSKEKSPKTRKRKK